MGTHLWRHLGKNGKKITISIGDVLEPTECRKSLTEQAEKAVVDLFESTTPYYHLDHEVESQKEPLTA